MAQFKQIGSYITQPSQAPAGTKRMDRLIQSPKWSKELIDELLRQKENEQKQHMEAAGEALSSHCACLLIFALITE
jgi:hypothetical protein